MARYRRRGQRCESGAAPSLGLLIIVAFESDLAVLRKSMVKLESRNQDEKLFLMTNQTVIPTY